MNRFLATPMAGVCVLLTGGLSDASVVHAAPSSLRSYIEQALETHPEALVAKARESQALAEAHGAAMPLYNPELAIEYEKIDATEATVGLSQTLDWTNKRSSREATARARAVARTLEAELTRNDLLTQALNAVAQFSVAERMAELGERRAELTQRFSDIATQRHASGDLPLIEKDVAILAATQARFGQAETAATLSEKRQTLAYLTGSTEPPPSLPSSTPTINVGGSMRLLRVEIAKALQLAAEADFERAIKSRRPDPTIAFRTGREGDDTLIGLSFTVPLHVRNPLRAEVTAADAAVAEANALVALEERRTNQAWVQARDRYNALHSAWLQWQGSARMSLDRQLATLERLWTAGELSTAEYLIQITQALETESGAIELEGNLWAAWVEWLAASNTAQDWLRTLP